MKTKFEIEEEIKNYKRLIKKYFELPEEYEIRERYIARIHALEWVLDENK